jgi:hypothetical protein
VPRDHAIMVASRDVQDLTRPDKPGHPLPQGAKVRKLMPAPRQALGHGTRREDEAKWCPRCPVIDCVRRNLPGHLTAREFSTQPAPAASPTPLQALLIEYPGQGRFL